METLFNKVFGFLNGYKTLIGSVAAVATFVLFVCGVLSDGFQFADIEGIGTAFSAMMIALGLGHKAAKIEAAIKK